MDKFGTDKLVGDLVPLELQQGYTIPLEWQRQRQALRILTKWAGT
eukprot:CAMPEP_0202980038 /NCGR_PEP_ID=MMETSP1396-20130829/86033_1 /ASSEMBLY_ACC=CAM_ASM_000872 /TAXON_ID= /ORGANISM="Pseudokeronopsis sp., Strain Brazil" /LENGTH=44 /DNA_ID= /DNA_START= /DNA_END= /DNA_ORIENTATION=